MELDRLLTKYGPMTTSRATQLLVKQGFSADAARQRLFDRHQKSEQDERHQNRKQRQRSPQLLPLQIAPDEVEEFHGA